MTDTTPHHESNRAFYDRIAAGYDFLANASERPARLAGLEAVVCISSPNSFHGG